MRNDEGEGMKPAAEKSLYTHFRGEDNHQSDAEQDVIGYDAARECAIGDRVGRLGQGKTTFTFEISKKCHEHRAEPEAI